jgi:hypothetical protein
MDISSHGVPSLAKRVAWRQCHALAIVEAHALRIEARLHAGLCIDDGEREAHERTPARARDARARRACARYQHEHEREHEARMLAS